MHCGRGDRFLFWASIAGIFSRSDPACLISGNLPRMMRQRMRSFMDYLPSRLVFGGNSYFFLVT